MTPPAPTMTAYFRGVRPGARQFDHGCWKPGVGRLGRAYEGPATPWFEPTGNPQSLNPMDACWDRERDGWPEGQVRFARQDGWTLVTMWDQSGDPRKRSSSVFALHADLTDEEAIGLARRLYPEVFARINARLGREVRMAPATCPTCRQSLETP